MMNHNNKSSLDQLVANIPVGVYRYRTIPNKEGFFEYVNHQFCEMVGLSAEALYHDASIILKVIHPEDLDDFITIANQAKSTMQPFLWEGRIVVTDRVEWVRLSSTPEVLENNDVVWSGVQIDITERKQAEEALREANTLLANRLIEIEKLQIQLQEHAIRDYLTGLYNRRYLDETIERELARSDRETHQLSVVMMDIDQFKGVNDVYGHQIGDEVLIELGRLLKRSSRSSDIACRYGGDEFVVVMLNASVEDAHKRADEWRKEFAKRVFWVNQQSFSATLSLGIATYPSHSTSPRGLFQAADEALYHSKKYNNTVTISRRLSTGQLHTIETS